jgi:hypothetical protein
MAITCNFDRDGRDARKTDKLIVRVPPGQAIDTDTPGLNPSRSGAYLWLVTPRRRAGRSWRDLAPAALN